MDIFVGGTSDMDALLSIEQTAEILSISQWTVRAWIQQGKLSSAKLGSRRLVPKSEIERLIADSRIPATRDFRKRHLIDESPAPRVQEKV